MYMYVYMCTYTRAHTHTHTHTNTVCSSYILVETILPVIKFAVYNFSSA